MAIRLWARPERRHPSSMKAPFLFVAVATAFSMAVNGFTLREAELDRQMKDAKTLPAMLNLAHEIGQDILTDDVFDDNTYEEDFTEDDEEEILEDVLALAEQEAQDEARKSDLGHLGSRSRFKRFTVDFNGMQVSYPTYVRLVRMQEKALKLRRMIQLLHLKYSKEELVHLEQYQRLIALYNSLKPLLPETMSEDPLAEVDEMMEKRDKIMDFMGMKVPYPQWVKLRRLQEKVIRLDTIMRRMRDQVSPEKLDKIPKWKTLLSLHASLKQILPPEYVAKHPDDISAGSEASLGVRVVDDIDENSLATEARKKRSVNFNNDVYVTLPEYARLMNLQEKALALDKKMRHLVNTYGMENLDKIKSWRTLVELRRAVQRLMPEGHPEFRKRSQAKRMVTTDFNGNSVSVPEYERLMNMRKKVQLLDLLMKSLSKSKQPEELESIPQWHKLKLLRQTVDKVLPLEEQNRF